VHVVLSVMVDTNDALHDAVSSSVVQICREMFSFCIFVKITGSLTFDVDGQQVRSRFCCLNAVHWQCIVIGVKFTIIICVMVKFYPLCQNNIEDIFKK